MTIRMLLTIINRNSPKVKERELVIDSLAIKHI